MFSAAAAAAISLTHALATDAAGEMPIKGWVIAGSDPQEYEIGTTHVAGVSGTCVFIKARTTSPSGFATLTQEIAADNYRGQRLRLSAQIKTDDAAAAQLWMRVDGPKRKILRFYNMGDRPVVGTTGWKRYDVVLDVPSDAVHVLFGYFLNGGGTVWSRDFKLEPVGKDVPVSVFPSKPLPKTPANMNFDQ
ncbi:MAG: transcriptional regulator [Alphaproteobacteria bacterium]|nr:transcriptional regulator [Alphaproteobacteria bacterium]